MPSPEDFVEVYHTFSTAAAQKILDVLLKPAEIEAVIHNRQSAAFPGTYPGGVFVAVLYNKRKDAVDILKEAIENGYLADSEGTLIEDLPGA